MISMSRAKINFGRVRSGSLTLKARTKPAHVEPGSKAGSAYLVSESSKQLGICCFGNDDVPDYIDVLFLLEKSWDSGSKTAVALILSAKDGSSTFERIGLIRDLPPEWFDDVFEAELVLV
jgi:hypothetical protein